jgi:multidrug efflux pump subunit AcrB
MRRFLRRFYVNSVITLGIVWAVSVILLPMVSAIYILSNL